MRTLYVALALTAVTIMSVAFHGPTSGQAEAARAPELDVATSALARGDALRASDPKQAAAFYRACVQLEGVGDAAAVRTARERLAALEPRKGTVLTLGPKAEPAPAALPVKDEAPRQRVVSVGPDGVVYEQ